MIELVELVELVSLIFHEFAAPANFASLASSADFIPETSAREMFSTPRRNDRLLTETNRSN